MEARAQAALERAQKLATQRLTQAEARARQVRQVEQVSLGTGHTQCICRCHATVPCLHGSAELLASETSLTASIQPLVGDISGQISRLHVLPLSADCV